MKIASSASSVWAPAALAARLYGVGERRLVP